MQPAVVPEWEAAPTGGDHSGHDGRVDNDQHTSWAADEAVLALIGQAFFRQDLTVTVRLPRALAEAATRAWERDDDGDASEETPEEARTRRRAGVLALIGLEIQEHGTWAGEVADVALDAWHVGLALDSADAAGLLIPIDQSMD